MKRLVLLCAVYLGQLYNDAQHAWEHGNLSRALDLSRRGAVLSALAGSSEWDWKFRCIQAETYNYRREWNRAAAILQGEIPASLQGSPLAVRIEIDRGVAQAWLGNSTQAEDYFGAAARLCQSPANAQWLGELELRRAGFAFREGHRDRSESLARAAIAFARQTRQPFLEANALTFLAALLNAENRWGEAVSWLEPAIEASRRLSIPTLLEKDLGNLGWCYYNLGDLDAALTAFDEAEKTASEMNLFDESRRWLTDIGIVYKDRGDFKTAESFETRALAVARKLNQPDIVAICLHNLAITAFDREDFKTAVAFNEREMEIKRASGDTEGQLFSLYLHGYLLKQKGQYAEAARTFADIAARSQNEPALRWQSQIALAKVHIALNQPSEAKKDFTDVLATFEQVRKSISRDVFKIVFRSALNRYYSDYVKFLVDQGKPMDALEVAESSRAQVLMERIGLPENSTLDVKKLQATARSLDAALFSYWLTPNASYLWVVTPRDFVVLNLPPGPEIEQMAESYRRAIAAQPNPNDTSLYSALIAPAKAYIPPNGRVIVIPDGALFHINFETLLVPGQPRPHYWIEDVTLSTATSLALLAPRPRSPAKGNILLIGNPVAPRPEFPALPYSGAELHSIAARFPASQRSLYEGAAAKPSAYAKAGPGSFSWIHFAAHGVASKESPLDSSIVLSDEGDSFRLYARDIAELPLHADLVTISACYGSGTRTFSGEGNVGLAWAFLLAGAHNVVASLWEANDYYTAQLMDRLYDRLRAGDDPAHALRTAKLSLLHSEYVCRNPRYWGAFQVYTGY